MFSQLIARTAMGLVAAFLAAIGCVLVGIGGYLYLANWIGPGPAALAMGAGLLLMAMILAAINRDQISPNAAKVAHADPLAGLPLVQSFWKERPWLCMGLIGLFGLLLARRPKTLTDLAAIAAQFLAPSPPKP